MKSVTRRQAIQLVGATGTAILAGSAAGAAEPPAKNSKINGEPPLPSKASPDSHGPRELFAVVSRKGDLKRGLHAVSSKRLEVGVYEVTFCRDVRRGVYLVSVGGSGYDGTPLAAAASVMGRATNPRAVVVFTTSLTGDQLDCSFHLLVVCPDGYA
jgi:hypothetical protein